MTRRQLPATQSQWRALDRSPPVCVKSARAGGAHRRVPDVNTLVEGAAGQEPAVRTEGHAVDGLLVFGERVGADASIHVPQSHRGVEGGAEEQSSGGAC